MLVSSDDQVKAYIKKIMSQLNKWMLGGKISKLVIVITNKDTGEHVERWQFDVTRALFLPRTPLRVHTGPTIREKFEIEIITKIGRQGKHRARVSVSATLGA